MRAGYVVVLMKGDAPVAVLAFGVVTSAGGSVFVARSGAEHNCDWTNTEDGREHFGMSPMESAEVMELHSIVEGSG